MALIKPTTQLDAVTTSNGGSHNTTYFDKNADGQREGNRRNVAATLTAAVIMANGGDAKKAIAVFEDIHSYLVQKDA